MSHKIWDGQNPLSEKMRPMDADEMEGKSVHRTTDTTSTVATLRFGGCVTAVASNVTRQIGRCDCD